MVEEDEDTEKIDYEVPSELDQLQAVEKENQINEEMLKRKPETMNTKPETKTIAAPPESPRAASQEYSQPQVEVINAGVERQTVCPEALFLTPSAEEEKERPRARVAFADPTLRSNPSTPVRPAASAPVRAEPGPSEEEMTLSSLGPEESSETSPVIETQVTKKVTEPPKEDAPINSPEPKTEQPKTENQLPTLGNIQR